MNYPKCHFCGKEFHHLQSIVEMTFQNNYGLYHDGVINNGIIKECFFTCKSCSAILRRGGCFNAPDGQEISNQ